MPKFRVKRSENPLKEKPIPVGLPPSPRGGNPFRIASFREQERFLKPKGELTLSQQLLRKRRKARDKK